MEIRNTLHSFCLTAAAVLLACATLATAAPLQPGKAAQSSELRAQAAHFRDLAAQEKLEWQRRSTNSSALGQKYPRPADSSRYRYEYFSLMASQLDARASSAQTLSN